MTTVRLTCERAHALMVETLMRCRVAEANARPVADALIAAELAGQGGHGLRRMPFYCAQALSGKIDGSARAQSKVVRPAALAVDAANGFAYPALDLAIAWLPEAAARNGIAIAGIHRSSHCGVAGVTVERLAQAGMLAIMVANAPAAMAPWGGKRPLFGTDPIAFAAPLEGAEPVIVDISLSRVARGKIMAANQQGAPIPEGWALDADGRPTTDAKAALAGTMIPMGEAKGTALAIMVEMLCAGLTGANYAYELSSFFDAGGPPPNSGQAVIAIDPETFGPGASGRFVELAGLIESMDGARLPGRRRQAIRRQIEREGIPLDKSLMDEIEALGRS